MTIHRYAIKEPSGKYWTGDIPATYFVDEPHFFESIDSARAAYASYVAYELKLTTPKRPLALAIETVAFSRTVVTTGALDPTMVPEATFSQLIKRAPEFRKENQLDLLISDLIASGGFGQTQSFIKLTTTLAKKVQKQHRERVQMVRSTWIALDDINTAVLVAMEHPTAKRIDVKAKMSEFGLDHSLVPMTPRMSRNRKPRVYA